MTREEAIDILEEVKELDDSIYQYNTKYLKALDMAIQALQAQADGEYISRNNAITSVCQWGTTLERIGTYTITVAEMKQTITDMLCELPTVAIPSAEPRIGHCKDCKHFRKLPYHADKLGKCVQHWGFCPPSDWYCADFEPQEVRDKK